jgi:hypothetical protein
MAQSRLLKWLKWLYPHDVDFQYEQSYWNTKRKAHNCNDHEDGVVSGLNVTEDAGGASMYVDVSIGRAVDSEGNDITLQSPVHLDLSSFVPGAGSQIVYVVINHSGVDASQYYVPEIGSYQYKYTQDVATVEGKLAKASTDVELARLSLLAGQTQIFTAGIFFTWVARLSVAASGVATTAEAAAGSNSTYVLTPLALASEVGSESVKGVNIYNNLQATQIGSATTGYCLPSNTALLAKSFCVEYGINNMESKAVSAGNGDGPFYAISSLQDLSTATSVTIAVGGNAIAASHISISTDEGETWAAPGHIFGGTMILRSIANTGDSTDDPCFVAVGDDNGTQLTILNADSAGDEWHVVDTDDLTLDLFSVCYGNGRFVAVGETTGVRPIIYYSDDGTTWSAAASVPNINKTLRAVCYGGGTYLAVGDAAVGVQPIILTSTDGSTWVSRVCGTVNGYDLKAASYVSGSGGSVSFMAVGETMGAAPLLLWTGNSGGSWTKAGMTNFPAFSGDLNSVCMCDDVIAVAGDKITTGEDCVFTSRTYLFPYTFPGTYFRSRRTGVSSTPMYGMSWVRGRLIAVCFDDSIVLVSKKMEE